MAITGKENVKAYAAKKKDICGQIKQMIVDQLCLDMDPAFISPDQPLFGRGLELDSIDSLELSVGVFNLFQISLSDDDKTVFSSVNALTDYVLSHGLEADNGDAPTADLSGGMDLG